MVTLHWSWLHHCNWCWRPPWTRSQVTTVTLKILNLFSLCSVLVVASGCGWLNIFDLSEELSPLEGELSRHILPLHTQVRRPKQSYGNTIHCPAEGSCQCERPHSVWCDWKRSDWACGQPHWQGGQDLQVPYKLHRRSGVTCNGAGGSQEQGRKELAGLSL